MTDPADIEYHDQYEDEDPHEECFGIHVLGDGEHVTCDGVVI